MNEQLLVEHLYKVDRVMARFVVGLSATIVGGGFLLSQFHQYQLINMAKYQQQELIKIFQKQVQPSTMTNCHNHNYYVTANMDWLRKNLPDSSVLPKAETIWSELESKETIDEEIAAAIQAMETAIQEGDAKTLND